MGRRLTATLVVVAYCGVTASCTRPPPLLREPVTKIPSGLPQLGGPCPAQARIGETELRCGREGRVSLFISTDTERVIGERLPRCNGPEYCYEDDPLFVAPPLAPIEYPEHVLVRLVLAMPCGPKPDHQTIYVDGKNLWIRTVRRFDTSWPVGVLVIADRSLLTAEDTRFLQLGLGISDKVDVRDDVALRAALDALPRAALARIALEKCALRKPL